MPPWSAPAIWSPRPFPQCRRLLSAPWCLSHQIPLGPREPPRETQVGTGGPGALPLPLLSGQWDMEQDGSPAKGRRSHQAGAGEACAPDRSLWQEQRLALCVALVCRSLTVSPVCLSLSLMLLHLLPGSHRDPPPRLLTCGLKREQEAMSVGSNAEPSAQGWGSERCWYPTTCLLCPCVWVAGSASGIARGDSLDQAPRSVGGAGKVPFHVGALSIPLPVCPQQRSRYRLSALRLFACASRRVEQTAGGQSGAAQVGKTEARRAACSCGRS